MPPPLTCCPPRTLTGCQPSTNFWTLTFLSFCPLPIPHHPPCPILLLRAHRYVVQAEFSNGCEKGTTAAKGIFDRWHCKSDYVLGASVLALLLAGVVAAPIWYWLHLKIGKRKAWLLWSLVQAVTNLGFFGVYKGDVMTCIAVSALNGVPMGAKFLADAVLADVIGMILNISVYIQSMFSVKVSLN